MPTPALQGSEAPLALLPSPRGTRERPLHEGRDGGRRAPSESRLFWCESIYLSFALVD